ncbi:hypothetical protein [Capybara microvirus Cap3_SP_562]|nr:hypothetical protein [Capybara microvirus Cap3_SP_562]
MYDVKVYVYCLREASFSNDSKSNYEIKACYDHVSCYSVDMYYSLANNLGSLRLVDRFATTPNLDSIDLYIDCYFADFDNTCCSMYIRMLILENNFDTLIKLFRNGLC